MTVCAMVDNDESSRIGGFGANVASEQGEDSCIMCILSKFLGV